MIPKIRWSDGRETVVRNIYCVGRNYIPHALELNNPVPKEPILFMKSTATIADSQAIRLPRDTEIHHELELVCHLGKDISEPQTNMHALVSGYTLGLDLTDRPLQQTMKEGGKPWFRAKSFRNSTVLGEFLPAGDFPLEEKFFLRKNEKQVQSGTIHDMIFSIEYLLQFLAKSIPLYEGDLLFTGTPAGVGPLYSGDVLELGPRPSYSVTIL